MKESQVRSLGREDPWSRKWQPAPVFLPGKFHGQRILAGYTPWGQRVKYKWATEHESTLYNKQITTLFPSVYLGPPDVKNWLIGKDPDAGKDWRQEKGTTEDEMVGWHHQLDGYEFEQALGVGDGQGSLACCSPWGRKESDTTEWLNWTE